MTHKELEAYLLSFPGAWLDFPFGEQVSVYKAGPESKAKMFALIQEGSKPLQVSLKCDPQLAVTLREKYESVQPGYHLNKKHWNTILLTGQLEDSEVKDLAYHSYLLVAGTSS